MKISLWRMAAVGVVFLAGCSGSHSVAPSMGGNLPGTSSGINKTEVVQNGTVPIHWTQFIDPLTGFGNTYAVTAGSDKNMYFGNNQGGLMRVTMGGSKTLVPIMFLCNATTHCPYVAGYGITVGFDGKFYMGGTNFYSPSSQYYVGVATAGGVFSGKKIPSGDYIGNNGLTLGPDHNVWFTEQKHIGKITPAGVITEFLYPSGATNNSNGTTTAGPDGNIWFTEYNSHIIGKIVPATGHITEYPLAGPITASCSATNIVSASDGNLYFDCYNTQLGQITTGGVATTFYNAYGTSYVAEGIIRGPDGNPWFSDINGAFIGEFNPSNQSFTNYVPPYTGGTVYSIALGPDGNIWGPSTDNKIDVYILKTLQVSPKTLSFTATNQHQNLTVTEPGTTAWTATSVSPGVCSVVQGTPANIFKVTSAGLGSTSITVKDAIGNFFVIPCHVT